MSPEPQEPEPETAARPESVPPPPSVRQKWAERAVDSIDRDALVRLLQTMVRLRSYSAEGEEGAIARFVQDAALESGLESQLQEVEPGRYNVISRLRGSGGGRSLMLNGHLDTNPAGAGWTVDPLGGEVKGGCIYGIGVSNMKAADAAYLAAVGAVVQAGVPLRGDVIVAHVIGELQGGIGTAHLVRSGVRADHFIVGEPTDLALLTMHAGSIELTITAHGRTRHLSKMEEAIDAIEKTVGVIKAVKSMEFTGAVDSEAAGLQRVAVGAIRGGLGPSFQDWRPALIADTCSVKLSIRYGPGQSADSVETDVRAELARLAFVDSDLVVEVERNRGGQRMDMGPFSVPSDADVVGVVRAAHLKVKGAAPAEGAVAPYKYYGTDAYHLAKAGMLGVVYGPGGKFNTMPDERVELADLFVAANVYTRAIVDVCL